jgi:hypothetical protein
MKEEDVRKTLKIKKEKHSIVIPEQIYKKFAIAVLSLAVSIVLLTGILNYSIYIPSWALLITIVYTLIYFPIIIVSVFMIKDKLKDLQKAVKRVNFSIIYILAIFVVSLLLGEFVGIFPLIILSILLILRFKMHIEPKSEE